MLRPMLYLLCCLCLLSNLGCIKQRIPIPDPNLALEDEIPEIPLAGPRRIPRPHPDDKLNYCEATDGRWVAVSAKLAGEPISEESLAEILLKLEDEQLELNFAGETIRGDCRFHSAISPRQLKISATEGPHSGKTIMAIYDFPEPGTIRICCDLSGADYPVDFVSSTENGYFLASYKRSESAGRDLFRQLSMNLRAN